MAAPSSGINEGIFFKPAMPPPLPDRYRLEVRLGRTEGVEEWLATDTVLDRPVQLRVLGPETPPPLREEYLEAVRRSTVAAHPNLLSVFDAGRVTGGVFAAYEWIGGTALYHRLGAGAKPSAAEFQPNAAGLADALSVLHEAGVVHARISPNTIYYSLDHPAKLGGVGPPVEESTFSTDVVQLVDALEQWAIGRPSQGLPLSELVDGISPAMDHILADAAAGELTSSELAARLAAAPAIPLSSTQGSVGSRVGLWLTAALIVTAVGLVGMGTLLSAGSASTPPTLESTTFQTTTPQATTSTVASPTTTLPSPEPVASPAPVLAAAAPELLDVPVVFTLDPYGGGGEMDHRLGFLVDGDRDSTWRTERYYDPLSLIKAGVGLVMTPPSGARRLELWGITPGTVYTLSWAETPTASLEEWTPVASGKTTSGAFFLTLPHRPDGAWLIWFTELPYVGPENYSTSIAEVRYWG